MPTTSCQNARGICVCQVKGHGRWLVLSIVQGDVGGKPSVNNKTAWIVLLAEDRTPAIWMWEGMRHLNRLEFCVTKSRATRSRSHFFRPGAGRQAAFVSCLVVSFSMRKHLFPRICWAALPWTPRQCELDVLARSRCLDPTFAAWEAATQAGAHVNVV